ncbi:pentatricopeptide repeat-containing protein, putative [Ricinus communis]|uniref:Pentatricopeptide repeat-containing protein, putative n=1 Tax=Ricinus communis TaxID=3988 RepID=B9SI50_RICCO|nr:pentatricopeptide repeat-containing protein, putative [Ricinus communis]
MQNPQSLLMNVKRPLYLWNLMIRSSTKAGLFFQALDIYSSMLQSGVHGNGFTFPLLLKACSNTNSIRDGTKIHSHLIQLGFQHVFVMTTLLDMYSKCYDLASSRKVFDEMPMRSTVSWNSIISAYCRFFLVDEAISMLQKMRLIGFVPTSTTFLCFLPICLLQHGLSIQCCAFKFGLLEGSDIPLTNALLNMYVKHGQVHEARTLFDMMHEKSLISWTTVIGGYVDFGNVREAFSLFNQMRISMRLDFIVFITLISGCAREGNLLLASSVHSLLVKYGCDDKDPIDNLLVTMYSKCGDLISAQRAFDIAREKSLYLWTSMIAAYTHLGYPVQALRLFNTLLGTAIKPNEATLATILSACADLGSLSMGEEIEEYILANGLHSSVQVQTSLIHMFCRCGSLEKAKAVFERLATKDLAAWSSMINGYAIHGMAEEAFSLFHKMQTVEGIKPDAVIYTSILLACSHSGLIEDVFNHEEISGFLMEFHLAEEGSDIAH